jgi:hypothetical protein
MSRKDQIFFQLKVLDINDPLMLGRIRGIRLIDNYEDILKSITSPVWNPDKDIWTERDPFIFNPLLPYFFYQVPKVDELVQCIYVNKNFTYENQYYIQNTFSSPTTTNFEYLYGSNKFTGTGTQIKNPKPLKNKDGTYTYKELHKGVFPEPNDNAVLGRGSADLIVKENEVLLRAGKYSNPALYKNVIPVANQQRAFFQLSKFDSFSEKTGTKQIGELEEKTVLVKHLIEWVITNPENELDIFSGSIYLYKLKPDISTNSNNVNIGSNIRDNLKFLIYTENFTLKSKDEVIKIINNFIRRCNTYNTSENGNVLFSFASSEKFPIFYRPNNLMFSYMSPSKNVVDDVPNDMKTIIANNLNYISSGIKLNEGLKDGGSGLIISQNKVGKPLDVVKKELPQYKSFDRSITYASIGAEKLFMLSHASAIPGKGKINFDDTLYGISPEKYSIEILPKTSAVVRGEELLELINLIVRFLITHTHAFPGLPPVEKTDEGIDVSQILEEIQAASYKILNKNIRIN